MSETLREALVRTNAALHKALAGIPQRDADEIIAHNEVLLEDAALSTAAGQREVIEFLYKRCKQCHCMGSDGWHGFCDYENRVIKPLLRALRGAGQPEGSGK